MSIDTDSSTDRGTNGSSDDRTNGCAHRCTDRRAYRSTHCRTDGSTDRITDYSSLRRWHALLLDRRRQWQWRRGERDLHADGRRGVHVRVS